MDAILSLFRGSATEARTICSSACQNPPISSRSVATIPVWPTSAVDQLAALSALVSRGAVTTDEASANFVGARRDLVQRHLETLALMGEVVLDADGRYQSARKVA
jgi:hypothetical protein